MASLVERLKARSRWLSQATDALTAADVAVAADICALVEAFQAAHASPVAWEKQAEAKARLLEVNLG